MSISLLAPLREIPIAVVDCETTGASADYGDRVIEIGIARIEQGRIVRQYQQLIDPRRNVSLGITAITGITPNMLVGQPIWKEVEAEILDQLRGCALLGHNIPFDLSFIRREVKRTGQSLPDLLGKPPIFDSVRFARRRFGRGGNGLQRLAANMGLVIPIAHRALADVLTTAAVFENLIQPLGGWDLKLCDALLAQGGPVNLVPANPKESLLPLALEEALDQRGAVVMEYLDARDARTERVIEPLEVRRFKGELTLIAHCHLRQDRRTFKVDRIVRLTRINPT